MRRKNLSFKNEKPYCKFDYFEPGSIKHVYTLIKKFEGTSVELKFHPLDKAIIAAILKQEYLRRRLVGSEKDRWKKMGIDVDSLDFPEWVLNSQKPED